MVQSSESVDAIECLGVCMRLEQCAFDAKETRRLYHGTSCTFEARLHGMRHTELVSLVNSARQALAMSGMCQMFLIALCQALMMTEL